MIALRSSLAKNARHAIRKNTSSSSSSSGPPSDLPPLSVNWLDLRGSGLSILERLVLEECLLRHDSRNWLIVGTHEASQHRYLRLSPLPSYITQVQQKREADLDGGANTNTAVILGLGGKPADLLNIPVVKEEGCLCIKRFTGGGTVVLDYDSVWTTLLFRPPHPALPSETFPRPIMEWSANKVFGPLFDSLGELQKERVSSTMNNGGGANSSSAMIQPKGERTLILDNKSCGAENSGKTLFLDRDKENDHDSVASASGATEMPQFSLRENDYVLGDLKMGGSAQSIVKNGWIHHTSFLWDYQVENMNLLTLPPKRPDYRKDRTHKDFLVKLNQAYPNLTKKDFMQQMHKVTSKSFDVTNTPLSEAMKVLQDQGGIQTWFETKSRTRVLHDLA